MLKALVFDLDDTLLDTSELLIPIATTPFFLERLSKPLPLMPGAIENLNYLQKSYSLYLLTFGEPKIQEQKIESLQIAKYFDEIYLANPAQQETKEGFFKKIAQRFSQSNHLLSIGNRRKVDIRLAKMAGLKTCLFNYGEHQDENPQVPEDYPDFLVRNHFELVRICQL